MKAAEHLLSPSSIYIQIIRTNFLRAAFKFGRGVHFELRRKMQKPPISRVPAILNGLTNCPS